MAPRPKDLISSVLERGKQVASKGEGLVRNLTGRGGEQRTPGVDDPDATVAPIRREEREGVRATPKGAAATPADTATERAREGGTKRKPQTKRSDGAGERSPRAGRAAGPTRSVTRTEPGAPQGKDTPTP
jgi:hypothetical protein